MKEFGYKNLDRNKNEIGMSIRAYDDDRVTIAFHGSRPGFWDLTYDQFKTFRKALMDFEIVRQGEQYLENRILGIDAGFREQRH